MTLLTLNTISLETKGVENDFIDNLVYELAVSIEKFWKYKDNKRSMFYTDLQNLMMKDLGNGHIFSDSLKTLKMELRQSILEFFSMQCTKDCINKASDKELEVLTSYDLYFEGNVNKIEDSLLLLYSLEKNTFLLSFNKEPWNQHKISVSKVNQTSSECLKLKNISHKDHVELHIKDHVSKRMDNISSDVIYSEEVKKFILEENESTQDKILSMIQQCIDTSFKVDLHLVKALKDNVFEIRVGSRGGLEHSQIRILFRFDGDKKYLVWYFIKHGENIYNESADIVKANEIYKKLKDKEESEK